MITVVVIEMVKIEKEEWMIALFIGGVSMASVLMRSYLIKWLDNRKRDKG